MRNSKYIPALVFLAVNAVYVYILGTVNSELSAYASLLLPSVFIVGPALFLGTWRTVAVVGFSAFLWAATTPVRAGLVACRRALRPHNPLQVQTPRHRLDLRSLSGGEFRARYGVYAVFPKRLRVDFWVSAQGLYGFVRIGSRARFRRKTRAYDSAFAP